MVVAPFTYFNQASAFRHKLQKYFCFVRSDSNQKNNQIKSSLYSPYYAEACNELRGPSPRLSAWATQLRRNVATVASRWRHCADLTGPGIEPQTSRTDSVRLATELTAGIVRSDCTPFFDNKSVLKREFFM